MANKRHDNSSEIIDIHALLDEYKTRWYVFAACIVLALAAAFVWNRTHPTKYAVEANLLIAQDEENTSGSGLKAVFGNMGNIFSSAGDVDDEVFIVSSHSVLRDAIKELGINVTHMERTGFLRNVFRYHDYPVAISCNPAIADTLMQRIVFTVKVNDEGDVSVKAKVRRKTILDVDDLHFPATVDTEYGAFTFTPTAYYKPGEPLKTTITFAGYNPATEDLSRELTITLANKNANAIFLRVVSTDVPYAKDLLNTIIDKYNARGVNDRTVKNQKTSEFINERLRDLRQELLQSELEIEDFKRENGVTEIHYDVEYEYTKKAAIEQELIKSETDAAVYRMLIDFMSQDANRNSLMPTIPTELEASEAIAGYNNIILKRMDLERNPRANAVALKLIDEQLVAMRENLRESLNTAYHGALESARQLGSEVDRTNTRLKSMPYHQRMYHALVRQMEMKEELYVFLQQRQEETQMTLANAIPKGIIVDEAYSLSEPVTTSPKMIYAVAFLLGIAMAMGLLYLRRVTRNKFETQDELAKLTDVPLLGEMCTSRHTDHLVVKRSGGSTSAAELFRLIRANLQFMLPNPEDKVILMTSTVSGEGKSFISINLASSLALLGKKVLLVGMDIRAPKLAHYLPLNAKYGLTEYLSRTDIPLDEVILHDAVAEHMDIIVAGPVPPNPSEMLLSSRVDDLFATLRTMYDYIIVDSAPVGMVSDSFALNRIADATVYVCRANYTTLRDVRFFNDLYDNHRLKNMSLVINGTSTNRGYGYGYGDAGGKSKRPK